MFNVNIIQKVEIGVIEEADIAALITKAIMEAYPQVKVNGVTFERKLSPSRIEATVDACISAIGAIGNQSLEAAATATPMAQKTAAPVVNEAQMELAFNEESVDKTDITKAEAKPSSSLIDEVLAETADEPVAKKPSPVADMFLT